MKKILACLFLLSLPAGAALAEEETGWYAGLTAGFVTVQAGGFSSSDPVNYGPVVGYRFAGYPHWSIEGVLTVAAAKGELYKDIGFANDYGDKWSIRTYAVYGVFRTPFRDGGDAYFKVRAGFAGDDINVATEAGDLNDERTSLSAGIGVGWNIGKFALEVDYTYLEEDVDFVGLTLLRRF